MFTKLFKKKTKVSKVQTAEEYWRQQKSKNESKAALLGIQYNRELKESSFTDSSCKYKIIFKGM